MSWLNKFDKGGVSFGSAFASARKELGAGKTFEWNGKKYTTNIAGEDTPVQTNLSFNAGQGINHPVPQPLDFKAGSGINHPKSSPVAPPMSWSAGSGINQPKSSLSFQPGSGIAQDTRVSRKSQKSFNTPEDIISGLPVEYNIQKQSQPLHWNEAMADLKNNFMGELPEMSAYKQAKKIYDGVTQRLLPAMTSESKESVLKVANSPAPQDTTKSKRPILVPEGYRELGTVHDPRGLKQDSLGAFTNMFDNNLGGRYIVGHDQIEAKDKGITKLDNVKNVAHFIMDGDILDGQTHANGYDNVKSHVPGKFINFSVDMNNPNQWGMGTKKNADGTHQIIYRRVGDITPEEKKNYKFEQAVRNIPYSQIGWDDEGPSTGYISKSKFLPTKTPGLNTSIPYKQKDSYSRFSGGSGIYAFKDPQSGKQIGVDVAGSINVMRDIGKDLMTQYGVSPDSLQFLYHDMGSYSAKPKAQNGTLYYNQWNNFNTYNGGYSGAPIAIPAKGQGGVIKSSNNWLDKHK